jgi:hypothetical protein
MQSVIHVVPNLIVKNCGSEACCHFHEVRQKWPRVRIRRAAKKAHAATTDKAEHAFTARGICRYRPNIVSDEDFEPSEITREHEMHDENLEGTKDGHLNVDSSLRVVGPDLPTPASP